MVIDWEMKIIYGKSDLQVIGFPINKTRTFDFVSDRETLGCMLKCTAFWQKGKKISKEKCLHVMKPKRSFHKSGLMYFDTREFTPNLDGRPSLAKIPVRKKLNELSQRSTFVE